MTLRLTQLRFAAVALSALILAIAAVSLTAPSARAFTMENLSTSGGNTTRFADPDERVKNFGQGSKPFGQNGPIVQFGAGQSPYSRPFGMHGYMPPQSLGGGN
jgi:hypothetical protein